MYCELKDCRDFGLKDQMTRSSISIPSNIAEGAERFSNQEFTRFLYIARGSAAELRTQLYIAIKVGVIDSSLANKLIAEVKVISAMLLKLVKSLET